MIVHDPPTALSFSKQQGKGAMRLVIRSLQTPTSENQGRIFAEHINFEIGKRKHAHLLARVVVSLVAIENGLPPAADTVAANKLRIRRAIVAVHVGFDVATIPGRGLGV